MRIIYDLFQLYDIVMLAFLHNRDLAFDLVLGRSQLLRDRTRAYASVRSPSLVLLCVHAQSLVLWYAFDDFDCLL